MAKSITMPFRLIFDNISTYENAGQIAPTAGGANTADAQLTVHFVSQSHEATLHRLHGLAVGTQVLLVQHSTTVIHEHQVGADGTHIDSEISGFHDHILPPWGPCTFFAKNKS
jgi:hypothetical protein